MKRVIIIKDHGEKGSEYMEMEMTYEKAGRVNGLKSLVEHIFLFSRFFRDGLLEGVKLKVRGCYKERDAQN